MQASHHTITGFTFIVLHKSYRTNFLVKLSLRERLEEIAP